MKKWLILDACLAMSLTSMAQNYNGNGKTASSSLNQTDSLRMDSIIHSLPDVMVKGSRPIVKVKGAALTYDLPQLIKNHPVDNAYDAIKQLPGVNEENDALTLNAMPVTVMIDGKATTMTREQLYSLLKSTPTSRIANAEVLYSAPARYQVKGQVINLQLKHNTGITGLQGELFGNYTYKNRNRYNERGSLLYTNKKWEIDLLYAFKHGKASSYSNNEFAHTLADGTSYSYATRSDNLSRFLNHDIRLGINYQIAKNHQISFAYTTQLKDEKRTSEDKGDFNSLLKINSKSHLHNFRLDYSTPFGFTAGAEYTYYQSPDEQWLRSSLISQSNTSDFNYDVTSNQRINKLKVFVKQEHDLGNDWGLNYGANYTTTRDHSSQTFVSDNNNQSNSAQTEDQASVYVGASKDFGEKLSMEVSLMEEYYHTLVWHEWTLFPTLSMTYRPATGHILQLDIDMDRDYPAYWSVKDFIAYTLGGYGKIVGNPTLKPSKDLNTSLTYIFHSRYVASLFIENSWDDFRQLPYQSNTEKTLEYKYHNFDHSLQAGLSLTAPINIQNWWQNRLTLIGIYQNQKDTHFYDLPFDRSKWFCMATWKGNFLFGKHLILNLVGNVRTEAIQGIIDIPGVASLDASLTWKPLAGDKLQLKAYCEDIFESADGYLHDTYKGQHVINEFHSGRSLGLSLTYRFGSYKAKRHEEVDTSRFGR